MKKIIAQSQQTYKEAQNEKQENEKQENEKQENEKRALLEVTKIIAETAAIAALKQEKITQNPDEEVKKAVEKSVEKAEEKAVEKAVNIIQEVARTLINKINELAKKNNQIKEGLQFLKNIVGKTIAELDSIKEKAEREEEKKPIRDNEKKAVAAAAEKVKDMLKKAVKSAEANLMIRKLMDKN